MNLEYVAQKGELRHAYAYSKFVLLSLLLEFQKNYSYSNLEIFKVSFLQIYHLLW